MVKHGGDDSEQATENGHKNIKPTMLYPFKYYQKQ